MAALAVLTLRPAHAAGREQVIAAGEQALAAGDADAALQLFERAAGFGHQADTELRTVRALMQRGAYRQALALCAHVAGEHRDEAGPAALHAWLLDAGGQREAARRVLAEAPHGSLLVQTQRALTGEPRIASPGMLDLPHRMAPVAVRSVDAPPDTGCRVVCTAALIDGGDRALAPWSMVVGAGRLWVRNGLGMAQGAVLENGLEGLGLALLRLNAPLPLPPTPGLAPRDPFAGSPGAVVAYTASASAEPAWPALGAGFLGRSTAATALLRRLGIAVNGRVDGAPVLDAQGRLCGVVRHPAGEEATWVPLSALRSRWAALLPPPAVPAPAPAMALDLAYEHALFRSLQLIVSPA
ncbi:tetratricopeptide repeat protein [Ideonella sp. BN130291]|uniref:tetratricopeptide repeat protein n=1 Tax=Ideonella sp. BN130291 TaxID=3112940 RepID=UPI002E26501A|nr:tetratricopeptide repeat protein [Ideonella sp. BN130291]